MRRRSTGEHPHRATKTRANETGRSGLRYASRMRARNVVALLSLSSSVVACGLVAGLDGYSEATDAGPGGNTFDGNSGFVQEDATAGSSDSSPPVNRDAGSLQEPDTSFDAFMPPPPPLSDGCPGSGQLGQGCTTADTCCDKHCSEKRKCTSSCKAFGDGCGKGECCVGFYCPLAIGGNTCAQCVPKGGTAPTNYDTFPPTAYNEACCSGASSLKFDNKGNPYAECN